MTWRELWQSTVTNLKALLGFARSPSPIVRAPLAPVAKRKPRALPGPVAYSELMERGPQTIDLTPMRAIAPPSAPLRTRKPPMVPVDVALDAAAFAALNQQRADMNSAIAPPVPDSSWERQGMAQLEMEAPAGDADGFDPGQGDPSGGDSDAGHEEDGIALTTLLESLLFVAAEPVAPVQLAQALELSLETIELGLAELADYYQRTLRGLRLQRFQEKVQLVTAPAAAPFIETFLNLDNSTRLSGAALETLAIIAYRQPVTRAQIEAVRGVDCAGVLRSLVQRGLVADVGRMEGVGRPILYGVTELFMQHFGLMEMGELPPLGETEADRLWAATVLDEQELDQARRRESTG